ncbi:NAD-dependent epimerase/dehydratase family protein [Halonotius sp. GCM10025705]|uniref:NAD-dependent epimerase/dehydratase family protein n=1 Tax=Halonotius sp. GCM10025705 TaxID=3252678 RepID=UPI00360B3D5B
MAQDETVIVTGGAGFIGSHLVDRLVLNNEVRVLDNFSTGSHTNLNSAAEVIETDLRDEDATERALQDVDTVFHQAAQVSVTRSVEQPQESFSNNLGATLNILEKARKNDFRVVLASSCAIYGAPDETPIAESHPKDPRSPYGLEKLTVDRYARLYNDLYDVETVALRYFNVYGPRQSGGDYSGVISIFKEQAENGKPLTVEGDGDQTRDFVHVDDVVRANLLAAETNHIGAAYNVGTGTTVTIRELAEQIRDVSGSDSEITHVEGREGDVKKSQADIGRIRNRMGFEPNVTLSKGLRSLLD